jgi:hypothetical protein
MRDQMHVGRIIPPCLVTTAEGEASPILVTPCASVDRVCRDCDYCEARKRGSPHKNTRKDGEIIVQPIGRKEFLSGEIG